MAAFIDEFFPLILIGTPILIALVGNFLFDNRCETGDRREALSYTTRHVEGGELEQDEYGPDEFDEADGEVEYVVPMDDSLTRYYDPLGYDPDGLFADQDPYRD